MKSLTCTKCRVVKSLSEFSPSCQHRSGRFPWCKVCKTDYQAKYINTVPREERAAKYAAWRAQRDADKEARARYLRRGSVYSLKRRYGITEHLAVELAAYQGGVCAICGSLPDTTRKRGGLHVDHNHATGAVRGLLCERCNLGLGFFDDTLARLTAAIAYLQAPPASKAKFTEPISKPAYVHARRNPGKRAVVELVCRQCGKTFRRRAQTEYASRVRGKEGPFCSRLCTGTWTQAQQRTQGLVRGLIHGTTNGYTYYKCRCPKCKKAHAEAARARVVRKHKVSPNDEPAKAHYAPNVRSR